MENKILVDADACPVNVKESVIKLARQKNIKVLMFVDFNHNISDGYSQVITVEQGADSVDFRLISEINSGDIVITQDYGVAAIALSKKARVIHPGGMVYSQYNIDGLLNTRFLKQKMRRQGKYPRGSTKKEKPENFYEEFKKAIEKLGE